MAIFLSRIKRALNVGSKSITNNGTYYASADGYDGYDEVTVNVSGGSATPITPSNANPVALSSGVAVEPTANGYAIESYDSVTPSSTPASVASGDIVKIGGSGVIVDSVPSPTSVTPSDSTPPQLSQGNIYEPTANGYLYATQQGGSTFDILATGKRTTSVDLSQYNYDRYLAIYGGSRGVNMSNLVNCTITQLADSSWAYSSSTTYRAQVYYIERTASNASFSVATAIGDQHPAWVLMGLVD